MRSTGQFFGSATAMVVCARVPSEARRHAQPALEASLHLFLLNRGVLLTPFHGMMLCSPATSPAHVDRLLNAFDDWLAALGL